MNRLLSSLDAHGLSDWSAMSLDGSNIRVRSDVPLARNKHPDITGDSCLGRSRDGFNTKMHLSTDGSGLSLKIVLSPEQTNES